MDEAIIHAEEVAEEKEKEGKLICSSEAGSIGCLKCADEHRQLAEWLKDYRRLKEQEPCDKCVYSTKDGYCQYDNITETIPPFDSCESEKEKYRLLLAFISGLISNKEEREKALDYIKEMMREKEE